ncbi:MAG: GntR family transcriptional regulator [Pirellulales bacterium]
MSESTTTRHAAAEDTGKKHAQLRTMLASEIASGAYAPGKFLPSEPELARRFAISRSTVRQALFSLEQDGLVERLPGKGTVVREREGGRQPAQLAAFAIVLPEIQSGHYPALVDAFASAASDLHYQILVCTTGNEISRQGDIILQLMDKRVAGVALLPPTVGKTPEYHFRQLQSQGIPIVMLHRPVEGVSAPLIAMPFEEVMTKAAELLVSRGHRRIAFLASHRSEAVNRYEAALRLSLRKAGSDLPKELIKIGESHTSHVGESRTHEIEVALQELLSLPDAERPTAIIDPWDSDMEACYFALTRAGIESPEQISLVSFGGASRMSPLTKRLAAVTVDEAKTAKLTAKLLDEMLRGELSITDSSQFSVPLGSHLGETVAAPPEHVPRWNRGTER